MITQYLADTDHDKCQFSQAESRLASNNMMSKAAFRDRHLEVPLWKSRNWVVNTTHIGILVASSEAVFRDVKAEFF